MEVVAAATPGIAVGHAIGRIGCFLVGDDYGTPSNLPWAVAFPLGLPPTNVPVHPTQLYETLGLLIVAVLLVRMRRQRRPASTVLGAYLMLAGLLRIADTLDRSGRQVVRSVSVRQRGRILRILCAATADTELELWGVPRRAELLEATLGVKVRAEVVVPGGEGAELETVSTGGAST